MLGLMDKCRMDSVGLENAGDEVAAVARQGKKGEEERRESGRRIFIFRHSVPMNIPSRYAHFLCTTNQASRHSETRFKVLSH